MNSLSHYTDSMKVKDVPVWSDIVLWYGESKQDWVSDSYNGSHHGHSRLHEKKKYWITVRSSIQEALQGGMNTVMWMSNTQRVDEQGNKLGAVVNMSNLENFVEELNAAENEWLGKHYIHFAATNTNIREIQEALEHPNVAWVKIYPEAPDGSSVTTSFAGSTNKEWVSRLTVERWWIIDQIADACIQNNKTLTRHSETPGIWTKNYGWWELPIAALHSAIERIIALSLRKPELKIVNAHTSLMQEAELLIDANQKLGTNIWLELSPQYMVLSQEKHVFADSIYGNSIYKCFPNVRKAWNNGPLIDLLASEWEDGVNILEWWDHAPHATEEKMPFTFAVSKGNASGITDILNFVYNEWKTKEQEEKDKKTTQEWAESFPQLFSGNATSNIAEVLNNLSAKHKNLSLQDRENRINFIKWFGGLPNLKDSVSLRLSIASKSNMTVWQFKNFIGNNCKSLHDNLMFNVRPHTFTKVDTYRPDYDYYNGVVTNPWKTTDFNFKKTA